MFSRSLAMIGLVCGVVITAGQQQALAQTSTITLPLKVSLADAQARLNQEIPKTLYSMPPTKHTCVKAERACTKIPEFRGFKIYSRMECIDVSPKISCDLSGSAVRQGPLTLSGSGASITASQVIRAQATARGRGAIGKNIRQSTEPMRLKLTATATPTLRRDWSADLKLTHSYRWLNKPEVRLFNLIPITFRGKVEPKLDEAIGKFKTRTLPRALRDLDLKGEVAKQWKKLQDPITLDRDKRLFLHIKPRKVAFSGINFSNNQIRATASMTVNAEVNERSTRSGQLVQLPNLSTLRPSAHGFNISLPIRMTYESINAELAGREEVLSYGKPGDVGEGKMTIRSIKVSSADDGEKVKLTLDVHNVLEDPTKAFTFFGLKEYDGTIEAVVEPRYKRGSNELVLLDPKFHLPNGNLLLKLVSKVAGLDLLSPLIEKFTTFELNDEIVDLEQKLNAAVNRDLGEGFRLSGSADLRFSEISVTSKGLEVVAKSSGNLSITGGNL